MLSRSDPAFALMHLTGVPAHYISHKLEAKVKVDYDKLWDTLSSYLRKKFHLVALIRGPTFEKDGIAKPCPCTIIDLVEFKSDSSVVRLVKLKGSCNWTGDWSKNSPLWTDELRQEYHDELITSGENSFMSFSDYLKWSEGTIASLDQDLSSATAEYQLSTFSTNIHDKTDLFLEFTLNEDIDCGKDIFAVLCHLEMVILRFQF